MNIILRELEWAQNALQNNDLGKKPSETLRIVARVMLDEGYPQEYIRDQLFNFILRCDHTASINKWSSSIDFAISRALKSKIVEIDHISISKAEMVKIQALRGKQIRRLAFTLICLSKYWKEVKTENDGWVNNKDNEIMSMANINTSIKRQSLMYKELRDLGYISFSKKIDNTNVKVEFFEGDDEEICISDFRNLGYQYLKYIGEPYFECQCCGITTKISDPVKGMKQKYCKTCAALMATKQRVNSVMRQRELLKNT